MIIKKIVNAFLVWSDTDMGELLEREGNYGHSDVEQEKTKRIRSPERLTMEKFMCRS